MLGYIDIHKYSSQHAINFIWDLKNDETCIPVEYLGPSSQKNADQSSESSSRCWGEMEDPSGSKMKLTLNVSLNYHLAHPLSPLKLFQIH